MGAAIGSSTNTLNLSLTARETLVFFTPALQKMDIRTSSRMLWKLITLYGGQILDQRKVQTDFKEEIRTLRPLKTYQGSS